MVSRETRSSRVDIFKKITFPTPEGGIVTVIYPLDFSKTE